MKAEIKEEQESKLAEMDVTDEQCICCPKCSSTDISEIEGGYIGEFWECNECRTSFQVRTIVREVKPCSE